MYTLEYICSGRVCLVRWHLFRVKEYIHVIYLVVLGFFMFGMLVFPAMSALCACVGAVLWYAPAWNMNIYIFARWRACYFVSHIIIFLRVDIAGASYIFDA